MITTSGRRLPGVPGDFQAGTVRSTFPASSSHQPPSPLKTAFDFDDDRGEVGRCPYCGKMTWLDGVSAPAGECQHENVETYDKSDS